MIRRAKMIYLYSTGGTAGRIVVENEVMTSKKLRAILKKYGGVEKANYCWFPDIDNFWEAVEEFTHEGAYFSSCNNSGTLINNLINNLKED